MVVSWFLYTKKSLHLIVFRSETGALKVLMRSVKNNADLKSDVLVSLSLSWFFLFSSILHFTVKHKTKHQEKKINISFTIGSPLTIIRSHKLAQSLTHINSLNLLCLEAEVTGPHSGTFPG